MPPRTKLVAGIRPFCRRKRGNRRRPCHIVGQLIGLDFSHSAHVAGIARDGKQMRNRAFHVLAQMFRRASARDGLPIVMLIEDLHWADDGSLDFLAYVAQVNDDVPTLQVAVARPSFFERRPEWMDLGKRIDLQPLDAAMSRLLVKELLKRLPDAPSLLQDLISGGAEGNPFYMEELVKMLVDKGALETSAELWSLHREKLLAAEVPSTLTGVLQARLDGMNPAEKLALQQASVIGIIFWDTALAMLDEAAPRALPALTERDLIIRRSDARIEARSSTRFAISFSIASRTPHC